MFKITTSQENLNHITRLSSRAIELAYYSAERDPKQLTKILYFYNRIPVTNEWKNLIGNEKMLLAFLGICDDGQWPNNQKIQPISMDSSKSDIYWRFWAIGSTNSIRKLEGGSFKLYISPQCKDLPIVISQLAKYVENSGAHAMKIGRNVQELFRPDKLMIYFSKLGDATRFGHMLLSKTCLAQAHGVPFTYPMGENGLLSIGFDPPETARWPYGKEGQSWRLWVTQHITKIILQVRKRHSSNPMELIFKNLLIRKIDPILWKPLEGAWTSDIT